MGEADPISKLAADLDEFAGSRGWIALHTPRNLAMALASEAGELLAEFLWTADVAASQVLDAEHRLRIESELADVMIYLTRLADVLRIDLVEVAARKMAANASRFPPRTTRQAGPPKP